MEPFDIWLAKLTWNNCSDARPWLIVDQWQEHILGCFPITSQCYEGSCFLISSEHPDFEATGLPHTSFIHDERIYQLHEKMFIRHFGLLHGNLLQEFRNFAGL